MNYLPSRFRALGQPIVEQWKQYHRTPGKWYKLLVLDPSNGRLLLFICAIKRQMLSALVVCPHNMSKTAINARPGNTALWLQLDLEGEVYTAKLGPASAHDIEVYTKCWSILKTLLS